MLKRFIEKSFRKFELSEGLERITNRYPEQKMLGNLPFYTLGLRFETQNSLQAGLGWPWLYQGCYFVYAKLLQPSHQLVFYLVMGLDTAIIAQVLC